MSAKCFNMKCWPWTSLAVGGWGSWTLWAGIWQLTWFWMGPVSREEDKFGGSQTTLLLFCFTHCRISYRTSPVVKKGVCYENTGLKPFSILYRSMQIIYTRVGASASEVVLGEQAQSSPVHLKASPFRPAQWILLLSPVEPVANILLVPQRWVYSLKADTHNSKLQEAIDGVVYFPGKRARLTQLSR